MATSAGDTSSLPADASAGAAPTSHGHGTAHSTRSHRLPHIKALSDIFHPPPPQTDPHIPDDDNRLERAKALEDYIKPYESEFLLYCEHIATILLVDEEDVSEGGALWVDSSTLVPSDTMKHLLEAVSPFCRHYMLHIHPKNLTLSHWKHAVPVPLERQPKVEDLPEDYDLEAFEKSLAYHTRFNTNPNLPPALCDPMEKVKCQRRDKGMCVVTGKPTDQIFWIIPFTWNDTVEHNDATGALHVGGTVLTGVNLAEEPNPACIAQTLGATHRAWNMLAIDKTVYRYLRDGYCALEYQEGKDEESDNDEVKVTLKFHWMPKLSARFGLPMNIHQQPGNDWYMMRDQLKAFQDCPPHTHHGKVVTQKGEVLQSGHIVNITMPKRDAPHFKKAIKVHWGCIKFTALCGAVGRPWLLSGKFPEEESMQKMQHKARKQDEGALEYTIDTLGRFYNKVRGNKERGRGPVPVFGRTPSASSIPGGPGGPGGQGDSE